MKKPSKKAHSGMMNAAKEQYHCTKSIEENGAIAHANALAKVLIDKKITLTEAEAVSMANAEVSRNQNLSNNEAILINKEARRKLADQKKTKCKLKLSVINA